MAEQDKWDRRYRDVPFAEPSPALVLSEYRHLLPERGEALDLAAGRGGNALLLARSGLDTSAWDISAVAMDQLASHTTKLGLPLHCEHRDVIAQPPPAACFDVIAVSRFLHRPLCAALSAALRPGGLLFYQTFTLEAASSSTGPANPDYLLRHAELLSLFDALEHVAYRDEGTLGDTSRGLRGEAWLVARRR